jgi:hypothetical protein
MSDLIKAPLPQSIAEVQTLATIACKSGLCKAKTPEAAAVIILTGMELGMTPLQSFLGIHLVEAGGQARPVLSAAAMMGLVISKGAAEYFRCLHTDHLKATFITKRKGEGQEPQTLSWTIEQAQDAGLMTKGTWKSYPDEMLRARCIAALCRLVYPDVLLGYYTEDELEATPPARPALRFSPEPPILEGNNLSGLAARESAPALPAKSAKPLLEPYSQEDLVREVERLYGVISAALSEKSWKAAYRDVKALQARQGLGDDDPLVVKLGALLDHQREKIKADLSKGKEKPQAVADALEIRASMVRQTVMRLSFDQGPAAAAVQRFTDRLAVALAPEEVEVAEGELVGVEIPAEDMKLLAGLSNFVKQQLQPAGA